MNAKKMNLDVLVKYLRLIDDKGYDSPLVCKVLHYLSCLDERTQEVVIKVALNIDINYPKLMDHVRAQFVILKQTDDVGKYCGLGFGDSCLSVASWNGWDSPKHADDVDVTKLCYKSADGTLRCGHLLDFAEMWMDMNDTTFSEFTKGITTKIAH